MGAGAVCLIGYSIYLMTANPLSFGVNYSTFNGIVLGPAPLTVLGMVVLLLPYQFCVMDMWQRCIATAESFDDESEAEQIAHLQRETFSRAIPLFLLMFIAWYFVGVAASATGLTDDPTAVLPALLTSLHSGGLTQFVVLLVVIGAFAGAIITTFDSFLMSLTQAFMYDWYGPYRTHLRGVAEDSTNAGEEQSKRFVNASRFWLALFGISAVAVAAFELELLSFWVGMYSLMLALFPVVYRAIRRGTQPPIDSDAATFSILAGFVIALTFGILGSFTSQTLWGYSFSDLGPLATLLVAFATLKIFSSKHGGSNNA